MAASAKSSTESASAASSDGRLSAYLDGELPPDEQARLEQDLAASPGAQAELSDLREVSTLLKTWDTTVQDEHPSQQFAVFVSSGGQSVSAQMRAQALDEEALPVAPVLPQPGRRGAVLRLLLAVVAAILIYLALHFWVLP